jgi:hypothetical protein
MRIISAITNANPAVVTTSIDHDYVDGSIVRLLVPLIFGMTQINGKKGKITVLSSTTFSIDINTIHFDSFSIPSPLPDAYTCAQVIPVGEIASTLQGATKNVK